MTIMVRDLPMDERPREKLVKYGPSYLSNAELLAILLRTGTKESSVLHVAEEVLSHFEGQGLSGLVHMSPDEIAQVNGVGPAKAATILAAVELGRRLAVQAAENISTIGGPEDAAHYAMPRYRHELQEHFALMTLDTKNHVTGFFDLTTGTLGLARPSARGLPQGHPAVGGVHHRLSQPSERRPVPEPRGHRRDGTPREERKSPRHRPSRPYHPRQREFSEHERRRYGTMKGLVVK